jgi:CHAT domain-containing protein
LEQENGELDKAEATFEKVLDLQSSFLKIGKKSEANLAHTKANIAALYVEKGQLQKAETSLKEAYELYKESKGIDDLETAEVQADLGNLYRYKGNNKEALNYLEEALYTRERKLSETHPKVVQNKEDIALCQWQIGELDKAYSSFKAVMETSMEFIKTYFPALSEAEKTKYWEQLKPRFFRFYNFATNNHQQKPELLEDLIRYRLATKGILLTASTALQNEIYNSDDAELKNLYNEWLDLKQQLANVYALSEDDIKEQQINVDSLEQAANSKERALASQSKAFTKAFESRNLDLNKVQAKLKVGEVLVEVVQFPIYNKQLSDNSAYVYLVIKSSGSPQLIYNDKGSELEGRYFAYYNNVIKQKFKDDYSYNKFFGPIESAVAANKKLYISPDGIYNQLNLNTLKAANGQYLIQQYDIRYIGHPNDLLTQKSNQLTKSSTAFLLGNPSYGNSAIQQLPGTKKELDVISQYLKGQLKVQNYTEEKASEYNLKQTVSPYVLHLASHGFFLEDDNLQNNLMGIQIQYIQQNPLLRSGLLLSGAATSEATGSSQSFNQADNGVFTAYEAINLNLANTEMVVLSACETGRGDVKAGEGVYGLQRAFIIAGAQSIIMSLWKVDDAATQQLMSNFYKNRASSGNVAEAFRKAQLSTMEQYKDPYYWGAFIMFSR